MTRKIWFTKKDREAVTAKLNKMRHPDHCCSFCHGKKFSVLADVTKIPIHNPDLSTLVTGNPGKTIPTITALCENCGQMTHFSAIVLGVCST